MNNIDVLQFVRKLKMGIDNGSDCRFVFFLGAGCSVSSGIPDATTLVIYWLKLLKRLETGNVNDFDSWVKNRFPGFDDEKAASFYGKVIEKLYPSSKTRQEEVERITERALPSFGYAVLAQLATHPIYGKYFNTIVTTNFDDLVADAIYLFTNKKPLVIYHESLINFVRISSFQPVIIKLHGDARFAPKNIEIETKNLDKNVKKTLNNLFSERGLIFIGYGGNDKSIGNLLSGLPKNSLPLGIYWVGNRLPKSVIGEWLQSRNATWVEHQGFDELMLIIWYYFNLKHPDLSKFSQVLEVYIETFNLVKLRIENNIDHTQKINIKNIWEEAFNKFKNDWYYELKGGVNKSG